MKYIKEYFSFNKDRIFNNLFHVSSKKLIGYLPLSTIIEYAGEEGVNKLTKWAKDNNLNYKIIKSGNTGSGALYIYDKENLQKFLDKNKELLTKEKVTSDADEFIKYIEHNNIWEHKQPELYRLIGLTFADKRFS